MTVGNGLYEMKAPSGAFIQFACAPNQTVNNNLFTKHLLRSLIQENVHITDIFQEIANKVYQESNRQQKPFSMNGLHQHKEVYLNGKLLICMLNSACFVTVSKCLNNIPRVIINSLVD